MFRTDLGTDWIAMEEYVILNFSTKFPAKPHWSLPGVLEKPSASTSHLTYPCNTNVKNQIERTAKAKALLPKTLEK